MVGFSIQYAEENGSIPFTLIKRKALIIGDNNKLPKSLHLRMNREFTMAASLSEFGWKLHLMGVAPMNSSQGWENIESR